MPSTRDHVAAALGQSLRTLRQDAALSLQGLAERSGVSRRLLVDIEAGRANASLGTLASLADALRVDFATLIGLGSAALVDVRAEADAHVLWSDAHGSSGALLAAAQRTAAELWRWRLAPGSRYEAQPDPAATELLVSVEHGTIELSVGPDERTLRAGDGARVSSSVPYAWGNAGRGTAVVLACFLPTGGAGRRYSTRQA